MEGSEESCSSRLSRRAILHHRRYGKKQRQRVIDLDAKDSVTSRVNNDNELPKVTAWSENTSPDRVQSFPSCSPASLERPFDERKASPDTTYFFLKTREPRVVKPTVLDAKKGGANERYTQQLSAREMEPASISALRKHRLYVARIRERQRRLDQSGWSTWEPEDVVNNAIQQQSQGSSLDQKAYAIASNDCETVLKSYTPTEDTSHVHVAQKKSSEDKAIVPKYSQVHDENNDVPEKQVVINVVQFNSGEANPFTNEGTEKDFNTSVCTDSEVGTKTEGSQLASNEEIDSQNPDAHKMSVLPNQDDLNDDQEFDDPPELETSDSNEGALTYDGLSKLLCFSFPSFSENDQEEPEKISDSNENVNAQNQENAVSDLVADTSSPTDTVLAYLCFGFNSTTSNGSSEACDIKGAVGEEKEEVDKEIPDASTDVVDSKAPATTSLASFIEWLFSRSSKNGSPGSDEDLLWIEEETHDNENLDKVHIKRVKWDDSTLPLGKEDLNELVKESSYLVYKGEPVWIDKFACTFDKLPGFCSDDSCGSSASVSTSSDISVSSAGSCEAADPDDDILLNKVDKKHSRYWLVFS